MWSVTYAIAGVRTKPSCASQTQTWRDASATMEVSFATAVKLLSPP